LRHHNYNLALKFFRRNLDIYSAGTGDFWGIGNSFQSIGEVYKKMGKLDSAYNNYSKALEIRQKTGYKLGITGTLNSIAQLYLSKSEINKAESYALNSYSVAKEIGSPQNIRMSAKTLHTVYKRQKKFPKAFLMYEVYVRMTDSIQNEKNKKAIYKQQLNYEFEKKAAVTKADEERKDAIDQEEKHKQQIIIYAVTGGLFLVFLLVIFVFRGYRQKQKANIEIMNQKRVIEVKQKEILDSIRYARRIQLSLMPTEKFILRKVVELRKKI
ncbi:MAG TPA: tetratricopeptide repeat protein, partial [Bacteroidia bacterium]|nr:tetratricopeptide repeat protein [Bacteroidia bacterium]